MIAQVLAVLVLVAVALWSLWHCHRDEQERYRRLLEAHRQRKALKERGQL